MNEDILISNIKNIAIKNQTNKAIGRYQGWGLVVPFADKDEHNWINSDFDHANNLLSRHGVRLCRWSNLSGDSDDRNEFGVKLY
jgi:hypothetical protein